MLFQSTGFFLAHNLRVRQARHEMKQAIKHGIPEDQRVVLKITPSQEANSDIFQWKHKKEFRYNGEMYDVLSSEQHGDTTYYTCVHDPRESGLFDNLDSFVSDVLSQSPKHTKQQQELFSFFQKLYLHSWQPLPLKVYSSQLMITAYSDLYSGNYFHSLFRPPASPYFFMT